jgi:beta-xylosidase
MRASGTLWHDCNRERGWKVLSGYERKSRKSKPCDKKPGEEYAKILLSDASATLKVQTRFDDMRDEATFYYLDSTEWKKIGITQKLYFGLDHFVGCRFGLFIYSTKKIGGKASFRHFVYNQSERASLQC